MHRLADHPIVTGYIDDGGPVIEDLSHCLIALFHQPQLHEHDGPPPSAEPNALSEGQVSRKWWTLDCQAGTGASVAQVPGPRLGSVRQLPEPRCQA